MDAWEAKCMGTSRDDAQLVEAILLLEADPALDHATGGAEAANAPPMRACAANRPPTLIIVHTDSISPHERSNSAQNGIFALSI